MSLLSNHKYVTERGVAYMSTTVHWYMLGVNASIARAQLYGRSGGEWK